MQADTASGGHTDAQFSSPSARTTDGQADSAEGPADGGRTPGSGCQGLASWRVVRWRHGPQGMFPGGRGPQAHRSRRPPGWAAGTQRPPPPEETEVNVGAPFPRPQTMFSCSPGETASPHLRGGSQSHRSPCRPTLRRLWGPPGVRCRQGGRGRDQADVGVGGRWVLFIQLRRPSRPAAHGGRNHRVLWEAGQPTRAFVLGSKGWPGRGRGGSRGLRAQATGGRPAPGSGVSLLAGPVRALVSGCRPAGASAPCELTPRAGASCEAGSLSPAPAFSTQPKYFIKYLECVIESLMPISKLLMK